MRKKKKAKLSDQVRGSVARKPSKVKRPPGVISTGSTLLDLAISGGVMPGGGVPGGVSMEVFGPSGSGKTMILCEMAGCVARKGGRVLYIDPEARLDEIFAKLLGFDVDSSEVEYKIVDTISDAFEMIREWKPKPVGKIHGVFFDSLAALTTDLEKKGGDAYGMRRAKEFSEQSRLTCRHVSGTGILLAMTNQVRENIGAGPYAEKYRTPGGKGIGFYASIRLKCGGSRKVKKELTIGGRKVTRVVGTETDIEVYKNSVWEPHHRATVRLVAGYGVDDVRSNLMYIKQFLGNKSYTLGGEDIGVSLGKAVRHVEENKLEEQLRNETVSTWENLESRFKADRQPKRRVWE